MKYFVLLLAIVLAGIVGWLAKDRMQSVPSEEVAARVQDQVQRLAQIATAEATASRMIRYDDPGMTDWFPGTDKRVIVKADARVLMGYDLEGVTVTVDEGGRALVIERWPAPRELAFEVDTEFFDIREGIFTRVGREYLNAINARAKARMRREVDVEALARESRAQAEQLHDLLRGELAAQGWTLRVEDWGEVGEAN